MNLKTKYSKTCMRKGLASNSLACNKLQKQLEELRTQTESKRQEVYEKLLTEWRKLAAQFTAYTEQFMLEECERRKFGPYCEPLLMNMTRVSERLNRKEREFYDGGFVFDAEAAAAMGPLPKAKAPPRV